MTEEDVKNELAENERITIKCVCDTLRGYGSRIREYLADFVASICNVERDDMFSSCNDLDVAQARWLYFYAYRYMTNDTYEKIGRTPVGANGKTFTKVGVATGINKMYELIEQQPIWRKRWLIIKRIIKESDSSIQELPTPVTIKVPKNVEITIKKE